MSTQSDRLAHRYLNCFPLEGPGRPCRSEVEAAFRTIIRWTGDNPNRDGLIETPQRMARAYEEYFKGYAEDAKRLQIQEKMTAQIANAIDTVLRPQGVGVVLKAERSATARSRGRSFSAQLPDSAPRGYIPGIAKHSITSTRSPGKIMKCGCLRNSFAASCCDFAFTTVHAPNSLRVSDTPSLSTRFVLPSGEPISTIASLWSATHFCHASIPACSFCLRFASGIALHFSIALGLPRNTTR